VDIDVYIVYKSGPILRDYEKAAMTYYCFDGGRTWKLVYIPPV
jgi:hypothetical protein